MESGLAIVLIFLLGLIVGALWTINSKLRTIIEILRARDDR